MGTLSKHFNLDKQSISNGFIRSSGYWTCLVLNYNSACRNLILCNTVRRIKQNVPNYFQQYMYSIREWNGVETPDHCNVLGWPIDRFNHHHTSNDGLE